jgi:hypothetical protein
MFKLNVWVMHVSVRHHSAAGVTHLSNLMRTGFLCAAGGTRSVCKRGCCVKAIIGPSRGFRSICGSGRQHSPRATRRAQLVYHFHAAHGCHTSYLFFFSEFITVRLCYRFLRGTVIRRACHGAMSSVTLRLGQLTRRVPVVPWCLAGGNWWCIGCIFTVSSMTIDQYTPFESRHVWK